MREVLAILLILGINLGASETITFDAEPLGKIPPGWSTLPARPGAASRWRIEAERDAPSRSHVLAQFSSRGSRQDHQLALLEGRSIANGDVSVDVEVLSGKSAQSAGLIGRFQDPFNYYFALASADKDELAICKRVNNEVSVVASSMVTHRIDLDEWNSLKVSFQGSRFQLFFGHRKIMEARDSSISASGRIGVWTKADTVAHFDNFRLKKKD